jgi:hypothetical protein
VIYDRLAEQAEKPKRLVDWTHRWEQLQPLGSVNGTVEQRIRHFCAEKRIRPEALIALDTKIKIDKHGGVLLAFAGYSPTGAVCAIKYRPLGGSSHDSRTEAPSTWMLPPIVGTRDAGEWYVVEGETDTARILDLVAGRVAVLCLPAGAKTFKREWADLISSGSIVFLCHDADADGDAGAEKAAALLVGRKTIRVRPPAKDWCDSDIDPEAFRALVGQAPELSPNGKVRARAHLTVIGDVAMRRVEWVEDGLIAQGMLTGLVAPGGTVKGLYGVHLAAKLAARGERTLFLCSEDALNYIVRPRFEAAGCDARLAYALDVNTETGTRNLRFPSDFPVLADAIADVRPTLVIVDPVASYLDQGLHMSRNNEVREVMQPLIAIAADTGAATIPVYHTGKDRTRGALESVAFEDACRFVLTAARDDEDDDVRHIELTKANTGRTGYGRKLRIVEVPIAIEGETVNVAKLVDEGRSNKSVQDLLAKGTTRGPDPTKREGAERVLREVLIDAAGEEVNADETKQRVADEAGVSPVTVWRAFTELKDAGLAGAKPIKDEHGTILEWRWYAKAALLLGRDDDV